MVEIPSSEVSSSKEENMTNEQLEDSDKEKEDSSENEMVSQPLPETTSSEIKEKTSEVNVPTNSKNKRARIRAKRSKFSHALYHQQKKFRSE